MISLPPAGTRPLAMTMGTSFTLFLADLAEDYARVVRKFVNEVPARDEPHRGGNAEALLAIGVPATWTGSPPR